MRHRTMFAAMVAARHTRSRTGERGVRPYKCSFCHWFHVGHQPLQLAKLLERLKGM